MAISAVAAANNSTKSAASKPDGEAGAAPKAVDDAQALEVATSNNRICVAEMAKLEALQEWANAPFVSSQDGK